MFRLDEIVRLMEAPFSDIEGMGDGERRVMVLIEILGKSVAVRVAPANLCKTQLTNLPRYCLFDKKYFSKLRRSGTILFMCRTCSSVFCVALYCSGLADRAC